MEDSKYPAWKKAYHEALLEVDPYRLTERIHTAETIIVSRLAELRIGPKNPEENQALLDAGRALSIIAELGLSAPRIVVQKRGQCLFELLPRAVSLPLSVSVLKRMHGDLHHL